MSARRLLGAVAFLGLVLCAGCGREDDAVPTPVDPDPPPDVSRLPDPVPFPAWKAVSNTVDLARVIRPGDRMPPPQSQTRGCATLPVDFTMKDPPSRANWDFILPCDLSAAEGVQFTFECDDLSLFGGFNFYFRSGKGWYTGSFAPAADGRWTRIAVRKGRCAPEGSCAGWRAITAFRISGWRAGAGKTCCRIRDIAPLVAPVSDPICLVTPGGAAETVRQGAGFADRVATTFSALGLHARTVAEADLTPALLASMKLVVLPYNPTLSEAAGRALLDFTARGGQLLVCYLLPEVAATTLGLRAEGTVSPDAEGRTGFGGLARVGWGLTDQPDFVPHDSWISMRLAPLPPEAEVLARWGSAAGQPGKLDLPALVRVPRGIYLAHIWLGGATGASRDLMQSVVGALAPDLRARMRQHVQEEGKRQREVSAWIARRPSAREEHRAVWCHSEWGLGGGRSWDDSIRFLKENGFNAIHPNLAWAGAAFYDSRVLPVAPVVARRGDALAQCRAACRKYKVECHPWKVCWNLGNCAGPQFRAKLAAEGRLQVQFDGSARPNWLCPSHPANRTLEVEALVELAGKGVDGVHLDYIRYPDVQGCFCAGCRGRFEARLGNTVTNWPAAVRTDETLKRAWRDFRVEQISAVVSNVAMRVHREHPGVKVSAAVFSMVAGCAESVGQDWPAWCRAGWLDFVCPMNYVESPGMLASAVRQQRSRVGNVPIYSGIGLGKLPEDGYDAFQVACQIEALRAAGQKGFTLFNFDRRAEQVLPILATGPTSP